MKKLALVFSIILVLTAASALQAQPVLQNDFSYTLEIPSVIGVESSPAHLYVLSDDEGMAVFRSRQDSLQWLYTASGMQQRGTNINADIRFAYLFGDSRRLTVLEPTSVMGAYSSTMLPAQPLDAERYKNNLYVPLGSNGLGILNLETPETLDSEVDYIDAPQIQNQNITQVETTPNTVYFLSADGSLFSFNKNENDISFDQQFSLGQNIHRLFFVDGSLWATTPTGEIFEVNSEGELSQLGGIGEPVLQIEHWNNWLIIKGESNRIWSSYQLTEPTLWKPNGDAGNYITATGGTLWISEYNRLSRIAEDTTANAQTIQNQPANPASTELQIAPIRNKIIPYPNALLVPLKLQNDFPVENVQFSMQTDVKNATIRGQSLYWQPQSGDRGEHQFKIVASSRDGQTSSTTFTVDVQPFNTPPRFTPLRTISIPVGQPFNLPISAVDPDGTEKNLIRYLGVNLPEGASIDEQTGRFSWTPTAQQTGENSFRVIATDQYGAASSTDVTIRVIETNSGGN